MINITNIFFVLCGGALGSVIRYIMQIFISSLGFSNGTALFIINSLGSALIGLAYAIYNIKSVEYAIISPLIITGFLGGFTTFSSYSWWILNMGKVSPISALIYILTNTTLAVILTFIGYKIGCILVK